MITELKPPAKTTVQQNTFKIFLAGSIEMDKAEKWQDEIVRRAKSDHSIKNEIVFFNPRRENWDSSWQQSLNDQNFVEQVEWELEHIENADLVVFYFQPGTNSPISLYELGLVSKDCLSRKKKILVFCPHGFYRKGNVDVVTKTFGMETVESFEEMIAEVKKFAGNQ